MDLLPFKQLVDIKQDIPQRWYRGSFFVLKNHLLHTQEQPVPYLPVYCGTNIDFLTYLDGDKNLRTTSASFNKLLVPRLTSGLVAWWDTLLYIHRVGCITYTKGLPAKQLIGVQTQWIRSRLVHKPWPVNADSFVISTLNLLADQLKVAHNKTEPVVIVPGQAAVLTTHIGIVPTKSVYDYTIMYNDVVAGSVDIRNLNTMVMLPSLQLLQEHVTSCLRRAVIVPFV